MLYSIGQSAGALTPIQLSLDYYSYLATHSDGLFRLNCEELTGQTNKSEGRRKPRGFSRISYCRTQKTCAPIPLIY